MSDDPHSDAHIRSLLGELGSGPDGDPMPPEVAARLEDTLARLVSERERQDSGDVVPLRRRWLPRVTAAAAAVVVLGAGGVAATQLGLLGDDAFTSADSAGGGKSASAPEATPESADADGGSVGGSVGGDTGVQAAPPVLTSTSFAADVDALLSSRRTVVGTPEQPVPDSARKSPGPAVRDGATPGEPRSLGSVACPGPQPDDGAVATAVRLDGRPAVLLVHPESDGRQLVEAWTCAGDRRLADATLTP